ncbi:MAG: hypothetical protein RDU89_00255 [bacterium]|nr:hypothetical protein [bacterium]
MLSRGEGRGLSRFLRVGFIEERLAQIARAGEFAAALVDMDETARRRFLARLAEDGEPPSAQDEITRALRTIVRLSKDTSRFLANLPCQPLLYTGPESTDTVVRHLEYLVGKEPVAATRTPRRRRRGA